jgi:putative Mg2+ transporter-C (MgtC) family protein
MLAASQMTLDVGSQSRIVVRVMTGIGFIGDGSILKEGDSVHGTTTAASLWNMGAIGACVSFGNLPIALLLCGLNYLTLLFLTPFESRYKRDPNE